MIIKVEHKQNLTDIAVQYYGDRFGIWRILELNEQLRGIDDIIEVGQTLIIDDNIGNPIADYLKKNNWTVGTGGDLLSFKAFKRSAFSSGFN